MTPLFQSLLLAAEKVYGAKKIRSLIPQVSTESLEGEKTFRSKAERYLQQSIESCHNAIAVISTNMDKLAGIIKFTFKSTILSYHY
jgi:DNA polymerase/3'-5' exonuclease PolX